MRLSQHSWQTYKEVPKDAEIISHQLMLRAGLIHKIAPGIFCYLPFAYRSIRKIENIIREEMDKIGSLEILMAMVTPGDLWKESGRWSQMGPEMTRFVDRSQKDMCLSPTNEETVTEIFRKIIKSYKQLPVTYYQINTKFRDEIRPRFGLLRGREFSMKDAYSFHMDKPSLDKVYQDMYTAYENIFKRLGLDFMVVEADAGKMGTSESKTHEFQVIASSGEDTIVYCKETGYASNIEKAQTRRAEFVKAAEGKIQEIETVGKTTIRDVSEFLGAPEFHSLKALVYSSIAGDKEEVVLFFILGDDELNETKVKNLLGSDHLVLASDAKIAELGMVKGYIGPVGLEEKVKIIFDQSVARDGHFVVGANKKNYHLKNFSPIRDLKNASFSDIRMAKEGDLSNCGKFKIKIAKGIEVGHIFQLGKKYTEAMSATVLDQNGKAHIPLMGCYGIGVTRTLASAIEQSHDENGIIWPKPIAPYHIYFAVIAKSDEFRKTADGIYEMLKKHFEVLYDDRNSGPGFMFKDADLLGLPIRLTMGERDYTQDQQIEIKIRKTGETLKVKKDDLIPQLEKILANL